MIVDMNMENALYGARLKQLVEHLIGLLSYIHHFTLMSCRSLKATNNGITGRRYLVVLFVE